MSDNRGRPTLKPMHHILRQLPTARKLQLIVAVFVCIVFLVLALVYAGLQVSAAARAYVGGEGLWSKAQKEATLRLEQFANTGDDKDYQEFLNSLAVPLGDRVARLEMEKGKPDFRIAAAGFRQGKIPERDIPGLIMLFRKFRRTELIETAASIWQQGDAYIDELRAEGKQLHGAIISGKATSSDIAAIRLQIEATDRKLTPLEDNFSKTLSAGAQRIDGALTVGLPLAACVLLLLGVAIAFAVVREIEASEAERSRAEAATRASEERYRELLENANDVVYVHDLEGRFLSWNRKAEELLGYKMGEAGSIQVLDVVAEEDHALVSKALEDKLAGTESAPYSLRLVGKNGSRYEVEVSSRILYEEGCAVAVQGIARDLTERKRLEAELLQAQKMEAVGRLAGGIAHDFNNILMIVRGNAESLLEQLCPGDPLRASADQIRQAANRAAELTRRLLGFSRKQVFEPRVVALNGIVCEITEMLPRLLSADIELTVELSPDAGNVSVDPIQLEQALMNLAVNSRDAMPQGGRLIISTRCCVSDGGSGDWEAPMVAGRYVEIRVQDSGCGMNEETLRHIYEPFFTTKEKDRGTGLGLSMVYGIVRKSGGYIFASSEVGIGTTMRIYLPQVQAAPVASAPEPALEEAGRVSGTVLLAEDEESLRALLAEKMRSEGYQVLEAANGEGAIALAERHPGEIHLLLTDVIMPKMRGPEAAAVLRLRYPEMKVIFMSGYTESALVQDGVLDKNTVLLQKPFSVKKVIEMVHQLSVPVQT